MVAGVGYAVLLNRSRFGFELRATGASATAAVASGIDVRRMVVISMIISGGIAALVGLPLLFGDTHSYGTTFQSGLGFAGIAVALLGRNNPVGIAFGSLLFAFLVEQSSLLEINAGVSNDIVAITQGVLVLSVVVAYEIVRRYRLAAGAAVGRRTARPGRHQAGGLRHDDRQRRPHPGSRAGPRGPPRPARSRCGPGCSPRSR